MKNLSLIIALVSVFSFGANAQSLSIGVRGGLNLTTSMNEDTDDNKYAIGMNFALPVEIGVTDFFSVQPELHYIQKGVKFELTDDLSIQSLTNYVELPVLAKVKFGTETVKGYAVAGPSVGLAFSRFVTTKDGDDKERVKAERDEEGNETDNIFDFGLVGGIGAEISAGPGAFVIDARYNFDLNDNTSFENDAPDSWNKTTNTGIGITVGYVFKF
ncbi:MAG: PorT family protein [Saprospiraceae bacterium]|nr:PorT family protein [Saprospiraceae bacterium]